MILAGVSANKLQLSTHTRFRWFENSSKDTFTYDKQACSSVFQSPRPLIVLYTMLVILASEGQYSRTSIFIKNSWTSRCFCCGTYLFASPGDNKDESEEKRSQREWEEWTRQWVVTATAAPTQHIWSFRLYLVQGIVWCGCSGQTVPLWLKEGSTETD